MRTLAMGKPQSAVLSAFVAFALAFTLIPLPAYAEEVETNPTPNGEPTIDENAVKDDAADNLDENKYTVTKIEDEQTQDRVNMSVAIEKQEAKAPASSASEEAKAEPKKDASALITQDGLVFQVISDTEAAFVGGAVNTNKLAIPATVKGYTVTAIACTAVAAKDASAALAYIQKAEAVAAQGVSKAVETIVIPKTVTSVDAATLAAYPNAKSIQVAKGSKAFATVNGMLMDKDKTSLVAVPEGLTGTAKLPSSLQEVPEAIFARASKVTAIAIDKGAYTTYEGALYAADKKVLVAAPAGIGTSIKTTKECTTIIEGALFGNTNLKTIIAQGELSDVATAPEADVAIKNVKDIAKPGETISPEDGKSGFAFTLTDDYTLAVKWAGEETAPAVVNIPDYGTIDGVSYTVTALAEGAFDGQTAVETVNIPNTVNTIGKRALAGTSLKSIVINSNITNIEDEAFAELNGTNIVVVNAKPAVAESATKASENLNIYTPYIKSGEYGWKTGLPATGNHICPYGVKFASSVYSMQAGETVDLYAGDGYWLAPGAVVTNYTYKAKYVSVDPTTGKITAKQNGSSALDVTLSIKVEETTETGTQTRDISLEPAAFGNTNNNNVVETGSVQRDVAALGDTATVEVNGTTVEIINQDTTLVPAARMAMYNMKNYSAGKVVDAYADKTYTIDVTAPATLEFEAYKTTTSATYDFQEGSTKYAKYNDGYFDPADTSGVTLAASGTITNNTDNNGAKLQKVEILSSDFNSNNASSDSGDGRVLDSNAPTGFRISTEGKDATSLTVGYASAELGYSVKKNDTCTFNVTIPAANLGVNGKNVADASHLSKSFGKLKYTFAPGGLDLVTGSGTAWVDDMFFEVKTGTNAGAVYNIDDLQEISRLIEDGDTTVKNLFVSYAQEKPTYAYTLQTSYSCWVKLNGEENSYRGHGSYWPLRLIGVLDSVRTNGNPIGLTFEHMDLLKKIYGDPSPAAWPQSVFSTVLDSPSGELYAELPETVRQAIVPFKENYVNSWENVSSRERYLGVLGNRDINIIASSGGNSHPYGDPSGQGVDGKGAFTFYKVLQPNAETGSSNSLGGNYKTSKWMRYRAVGGEPTLMAGDWFFRCYHDGYISGGWNPWLVTPSYHDAADRKMPSDSSKTNDNAPNNGGYTFQSSTKGLHHTYYFSL